MFQGERALEALERIVIWWREGVLLLFDAGRGLQYITCALRAGKCDWMFQGAPLFVASGRIGVIQCMDVVWDCIRLRSQCRKVDYVFRKGAKGGGDCWWHQGVC